MGLDAHAQIVIGFIVEEADLFDIARADLACPKGHGPPRDDSEMFCPRCGSRYECAEIRVPKAAISHLVKFDGDGELPYIELKDPFSVQGVSANTGTDEEGPYALGIKLRGGDFRGMFDANPVGKTMDEIAKIFARVEELRQNLGAKSPVKLYLSLYLDY